MVQCDKAWSTALESQVNQSSTPILHLSAKKILKRKGNSIKKCSRSQSKMKKKIQHAVVGGLVRKGGIRMNQITEWVG